jgi:hypothetical protein
VTQRQLREQLLYRAHSVVVEFYDRLGASVDIDGNNLRLWADECEDVELTDGELRRLKAFVALQPLPIRAA